MGESWQLGSRKAGHQAVQNKEEDDFTCDSSRV